MRKFLIAGNWKMNGSQTMASDLASGVCASLKAHSRQQHLIDVLLCPPFVYAGIAKASLAEGSPVAIGAQNTSEMLKGAFTGEISLQMLEDIGCTYVLLGHSERRELYFEDNELVAKKFAACSEYNANSASKVIPILCVGETLVQRNANQTEAVVGEQIDAVLQKVGVAGFSQAVIAYEPVWAIGTGETAEPEQAQQVHAFIRKKIADLDAQIAADLQILYGGSMKPSNAKDLLAQADIDGGLIGGASLEVESFAGICTAAIELSS